RSTTTTPTRKYSFTSVLLALQRLATAYEPCRDGEEEQDEADADQVEHAENPPRAAPDAMRSRRSRSYIFTRSASVMRRSTLTRSGNQFGTPSLFVSTIEPGAPWLPPGGVTPPLPVKYGTLASR